MIKSHCAGCFAGLSCSSRIEILNLLQEKGQMSVLEIAKHFNLSQPTISHHLKYLQQAGILESSRLGKKIYYQIHPKCDLDLCRIFS